MKKYFIRIFAFFFIFILLFVSIICMIPDQFGQSYQRAIVRQYDYYKSINDNKILLIGGSSLSFGIDLNYLEQLTGQNCAILGNHYGDGLLFQIEMAKSNLHSGDIVVIEYMNYGLQSAEGELLLSGVGKRYDMFRFFPKEMLRPILQSYPGYFMKNLNYWRSWGYDPSEPYCLSVYDGRGNMAAYRGDCWIPEEYTLEVEEKYKYADFESFYYAIDEPFIKRLNEFSDECEERGVTVLYTVPCYYEKAVHNGNYMELYDQKLSELLNATLISKSNDYIFHREYIYDAIAHCNTAGAEYRTQLLYQDLQPYLT